VFDNCISVTEFHLVDDCHTAFLKFQNCLRQWVALYSQCSLVSEFFGPQNSSAYSTSIFLSILISAVAETLENLFVFQLIFVQIQWHSVMWRCCFWLLDLSLSAQNLRRFCFGGIRLHVWRHMEHCFVRVRWQLMSETDLKKTTERHICRPTHMYTKIEFVNT
jgi:hypothetical protein